MHPVPSRLHAGRVPSRRSRASIALVVLVLRWGGCAGGEGEERGRLYDEPWREQFHFSPRENWMNDPNGLLFHDGVFHLFFQHNPFGEVWGHMSWGHATSEDLVRWEQLPVAIPEDDEVAIFSGSAVVDVRNTSGLAQKVKHGPTRSQTTTDCSCAQLNRVEWQLQSDHSPTAVKQELENEFKISVEQEEERWVLLVSLAGLGMYFVGEFDGEKFVEDSEFSWFLIDHGPDFYAANSFNGAEERVLVAWMNNWACAGGVPTSPWRGEASFPRRVELVRAAGALQMRQVLGDFGSLGGQVWTLRDATIAEELISRGDGQSPKTEMLPFQINEFLVAEVLGSSFPMTVEMRLAGTPGLAEFGIMVRRSADGTEYTRVGLEFDEDGRPSQGFLNRTLSGTSDFSPDFARAYTADIAYLHLESEEVSLLLLLDESSVEAFFYDGLVAMTARIFPDDLSRGMALYQAEGEELRVSFFEVRQLPSIWQ
ncbi:unnamed protein product [Darwinula stevensoni]|uniref:Levanase n=1 Tax=Darwinula stevensoni TaxID=69355 RepID=A0A7R9AH35_9CRUS|nr:unnamed protein product [Darwinula stevensoni]CAG0904868.1 unnamed protein product [Darwinula stevensoni]